MPPDNALNQLRFHIQRLHRMNGEPSTRTISKRLCKEISHTTVAKLLRCEEIPSWGTLDPLVRELGGDEKQFRKLWVKAQDQQNPLALPPGLKKSDELDAEAPPILQLTTFAEADAAEEDINKHSRAQEKEEDSLRDQLAEARGELADLNDQLADFHHQVRQLKQLVDEDRNFRNDLQEQISDLEKERDLLREQIEVLRNRLRRSREDKVELLEQRAQLATRRSELYFEWARSEELMRHRAKAEQHNEHT